MKKFILLATLVSISYSLIAIELSNPSFEDGNAWWGSQVKETAKASFDFSSTVACTGSKACHVKVETITDQNWHIQLNMLNNWEATTGNNYIVTFYAKADANATIHVAAQGGAPGYAYKTGADATLQAGADWKQVTFEYIADADGAGAVNFNIFIGTAVTDFYFDDFTLTEIVNNPLPTFPAPPTEGAFTTGVYRNLFMEAGKDSAAVVGKVNTAFDKLFYGDNDNERLYYQVEQDMAIIADINSGDIRSEGMSYGMMIAVQLNKKFEFDCLWKFAKTYMQHKEGPRKGYFSWSIDPATRKMTDLNSAADGEEYFAMALFFASHRWGNGEGIYNYGAEANQLLSDMIHLEERNGGVVDGLTNMFDLEEKQVVFVPQGGNAQFTDPSYHLPSFYKLWAEWADNDKDFWQAAADTSRAFLIRATHPNSGLTTEYMNFDGTPHAVSFNPNADKFSSDSYRVAMNIAMDCNWWGYESWHSEQLDTLLLFLSDFGTAYQSQYEWDGTLLEKNYAATAFFAMNGVAPLGATVQQSWDYINKLYSLSVPSGQWRYYDGLLYMLAMLNSSGQYKIWKPGDDVNNPAPVAPAEVVVFDPFKEVTSVELTSAAKVSVYTMGTEVYISNNGKEEIKSANIVDVYGSVVAQCNTGISANSTVSVTLPNVSTGVYFVSVTTQSGSSVTKIVIE